MYKPVKVKIRLAKTGRRAIDTKSLEYLIYGYEKCLETLMTDNDKKKLFYAGVASIINILGDVYDQSDGKYEYDYAFNKENLIESIDMGLHAANMMMNRRKTDLQKAIEEVEFYQNR